MRARLSSGPDSAHWATVQVMAGDRLITCQADDRWAALDFVNGTLGQLVPHLTRVAAARYENLFELTLFVEPGKQRVNLPEVGVTIAGDVRDFFELPLAA